MRIAEANGPTLDNTEEATVDTLESLIAASSTLKGDGL